MGLAINKKTFTDEDHATYQARLHENLTALRQLLSDPQFAVGPQSVGAELELSMVDAKALALPMNQEVLEACNNEHTQPELDSFNLEYNFSPTDLAGASFANLQNQISLAMDSLDSFARGFDGRVVSIGILPTLRRRDLTPDNITDLPRYHAPADGLRPGSSSISLGTGGTQSLDIDFGPAHGNEFYLVLGSGSGWSPGFPLGGGQVPLSWDPYTNYTLISPNSGLMPGSLGVLSSQGDATATLTLPAVSNPAWVGLRLYHAAIAIDLVPAVVGVTNPVYCSLTP